MLRLRHCLELNGLAGVCRDRAQKALSASRFFASIVEPSTLRILVVEAYSGPGMKNLESVGATPASDLMQSLLVRAWATPKVDRESQSSQPLEFTVLKPALLGSPDDFPSAADLTEVRTSQCSAIFLEILSKRYELVERLVNIQQLAFVLPSLNEISSSIQIAEWVLY